MIALGKNTSLISNATRISVGLLLIVLSALGISYSIGFLPSHDGDRIQHQLEMARSLAIQFSTAVENKDATQVQDLAGSIVGSLPDVASVGLRRTDGRLVFATADHATKWRDAGKAGSGNRLQQVKVAIFDHAKQWGQLELTFFATPVGWMQGLGGLFLFVAATCLLGFMFFMKRTLRVLDPSQVIPERIRSMLNTLAEGAAITDADGRIVLANQKLARILNASPESLLGVDLAGFAWKLPSGRQEADSADRAGGDAQMPWADPSAKTECRGQMVQLHSEAGVRSLMVNASSIFGGQSSVRGCVFTFDDVTGIEEKNQQLFEMVQQLGQAQQRLQQQNDELHRLATRDVLTGCLNRRAFHEQSVTLFALAQRQKQPLSVIMVDIDHFKAVNDNHGHARGDEILRGVGERLRDSVRGSDVVSRYGGEEFCILVPATDLEGAQLLAEKLRSAIASGKIAELEVTASLGISCTTLGGESVQIVIGQADEALYNSKHAGRNRSTRIDQLDVSVPVPATDHIRREQSAHEHIPVEAVRSLLAALSFRDPQTAQHSRRVSELCVKVGSTWLNAREMFILETAALLHDIGKVGVPDAVLLKPGPLTEDEWRLMREHDRIGVEIISTAFNCLQLTAIIANHHSRHQWNADSAAVQGGEIVPLCARLLIIADAYDAMTTHRCYRPATSHDSAITELRRCAGTQFDPLLVEHFINVVSTPSSMASFQDGSDRLAKTLRLSMEAEMLASKLFEKDLESVVALAKHMAQTAVALGSQDVAEQCDRITRAVESAADTRVMVGETCNLLNLVREKSGNMRAA